MDKRFWVVFQKDSVANQRAHFRSILQNESHERRRAILSHYTKDYDAWCSKMELEKNPRISIDERVLLYFCIWGELSNLRFMPEFLFFLLHCAEWSERRSRWGKEDFLCKIAIPCYDALRDAFRTGKNYDDLNEHFCDRTRLEQLTSGGVKIVVSDSSQRFELLFRADWKSFWNQSDSKTFHECCSVFSLLYLFRRIIATHLLLFIFAFGLKFASVLQLCVGSNFCCIFFEIYDLVGSFEQRGNEHQRRRRWRSACLIWAVNATALWGWAFEEGWRCELEYAMAFLFPCHVYITLRAQSTPLVHASIRRTLAWTLIFIAKTIWFKLMIVDKMEIKFDSGQSILSVFLICLAFCTDTILWFHIYAVLHYLATQVPYIFMRSRTCSIPAQDSMRISAACLDELRERDVICKRTHRSLKSGLERSEDEFRTLIRSLSLPREARRRLSRLESTRDFSVEYSTRVVTQLIPHYSEQLFTAEASDLLREHHGDEFSRRELQEKYWSSLREQTLFRTLTGFSSMKKVFRNAECLVSVQKFAEIRNTDAFAELLWRFPSVRFCYVEKSVDGDFYSCMIQGSFDVKYSVKLPGNPFLGDGKGDNQNNAIIFSRGNLIQTMDANQDGYVEEYATLPRVLRRFDSDEPPAIVGMGENIFSSVGTVGTFAALNELAFGTITQCLLGSHGSRLHYGHPDVMYKPFMASQGGVSRAILTINLSEDVFCGMETALRGHRVDFDPFLCRLGKGRNMNLISVMNFYSKLSRGNARVSSSRQAHRVSSMAPLGYLFDFFYAHIGFYCSQYKFSLILKLMGQLLLLCSVVDNFYGTLWVRSFLRTCDFVFVQEVLFVSTGILPHALASCIDAASMRSGIFDFAKVVLSGFYIFSTLQMEWIACAFESEFENGGASYVMVDRLSRATRRQSHSLFACSYGVISRTLEQVFVLILSLCFAPYLRMERLFFALLCLHLSKLVSISWFSFEHAAWKDIWNDGYVWIGWTLSSSWASWVQRLPLPLCGCGIKSTVSSVVLLSSASCLVLKAVPVACFVAFVPWNLLFLWIPWCGRDWISSAMFGVSVVAENLVWTKWMMASAALGEVSAISVSALHATLKFLLFRLCDRWAVARGKRKMHVLLIAGVTWAVWLASSCAMPLLRVGRRVLPLSFANDVR